MDNNELSTNLASLGTDCISRQRAIDAFNTNIDELVVSEKENAEAVERYLNRVIDKIKQLPPIQPKRGKWILDRSGAYCCSECMEPCAGYVMMKPRDKFCKMCGAKMEGIT